MFEFPRRHPEVPARSAGLKGCCLKAEAVSHRGSLSLKLSAPVLFFSLALLPLAARAQSIDEKAQVCSACHGASGIPQQKNIPVIWGQQLGYLFIELRDFKSGARKNELMSPIAQGLDQADLLPLAQYFSQKQWPDLQAPQASAEVAAQAQRANNSVVCTSCHQEGFKGDSSQPRLAGQEREYLEKTMTDFRSGARGNNPGMTDLMKAVAEPDIAALAVYLAGM
jgi:cytochrome c553